MNNRAAAFFAYLIPIISWIYIFLFRRHDKFVIFHTKQAIVLLAIAVFTPLVWGLLGWLISLIPYAGFILMISAFALVIALYIALFFVWLMGMVDAIQSRQRTLPLVGRWASRLPVG